MVLDGVFVEVYCKIIFVYYKNVLWLWIVFIDICIWLIVFIFILLFDVLMILFVYMYMYYDMGYVNFINVFLDFVIV